MRVRIALSSLYNEKRQSKEKATCRLELRGLFETLSVSNKWHLQPNQTMPGYCSATFGLYSYTPLNPFPKKDNLLRELDLGFMLLNNNADTFYIHPQWVLIVHPWWVQKKNNFTCWLITEYYGQLEIHPIIRMEIIFIFIPP